MKRTKILVIVCFALAIGTAFTTNRAKRLKNPIGFFSSTLFGETNASDCTIGHAGAICTINPGGQGPYLPVYYAANHVGDVNYKLKRVNL